MIRIISFILLIVSAFAAASAQTDSVIVGKVTTISADDTLFVPVYFAIDEGFCFAHMHFTWASADGKIEAVGIMPGTAEGWRVGVDSIDNVNKFVSVIGENFNSGTGGRFLPFYLVFVLDNPQYQAVSIGTDGTLRLGACDGLGGVEPDFSPGEIRYMSFLPGDANSSGRISGADVIYILSYLSRRRLSLANPRSADPNGDCATNALDVLYLINYFKGWGPEPVSGACQ